jgi:sporulation protein YlmC with PRC-barrel domain
MKVLYPLLLAVLSGAAVSGEPVHAVLASTLIGMEVRKGDSAPAGRIDDLVVDLHDSRVHHAVLNLHGELVSQPLSRLEFPPEEDYAVLGASARRAEAIEPRAGMRLARASVLLGWEVEIEGGAQVGAVTDLVVDPSSGAVPFAAVRSHDSGRLYPVPLDAFELHLLRDNLVLAADRQALLSADGFNREALDAGLQDLEFLQQQAAAADRLTPGMESASLGASLAARESGALFRRLDRNGDGVLDRHELDRRRAERKSWIALDLDRDGRITPDEFTGVRAE